jgi:exodeoxyribonuclease VII large subunit
MNESYLQEHIYSVAQITQEIKTFLESEFPSVWVTGEISNFTHHSSGHMYFSLKDDQAQINCVMWRSRNMQLSFRPQAGLKIVAWGQIRVYEKRGNYQLDCLKMLPAGVGDLQQAFEALKKKLYDEGLFDEQSKQPLPVFPKRVAIITSPTGAAIRDIIHIMNKRMPLTEIILRPTLVQGEGAADDIAAALRDVNDYAHVDVIIVGRGGGSLEDLWAFNEEKVARAIFASRIPVISAVGHEIDFTIADFVADYRAPTPSAAAQVVIPDQKELLATCSDQFKRSLMAVTIAYKDKRKKLKDLSKRYAFKRPQDRLLQHQQRLDELYDRITWIIKQTLENYNRSLRHLHSRLAGLHPRSILKRGYAMVRNEKKQSMQTSHSGLENADVLNIYFYDGAVQTRISKTDLEYDSLQALIQKMDFQGKNDEKA